MAISKPKKKLTDLAKELGLPVQDILDFYANEMKTEKKSSASAELSDVNLIIEFFSQKNAVDDFDAYFAMRGQKPAPSDKKNEQDKNILKSIKQIIPKVKPPQKPAAKKETEPRRKAPAPATPVAANPDNRQTRQETSDNQNAQKPAANNRQGQSVQSVQTASGGSFKNSQNTQNTQNAQNVRNAQNIQNNQNVNRKQSEAKPTVSKSDQFKERYSAKDALDRAKKSDKQDKNAAKKVEQNPARKQQTIVGNIADASTVDQKIHNVDTRGTYVEIDKYNERYDNIAPTNIGGKRQDSFKSKQKITQKSVQRKNQQYSSKQETEAQKMRRLELERARKQQIRVLIPDEIIVSELALRLKMTAPTVIKQLMKLGEMKTINDILDYDTAALVAEELGAKVEKEVILTIEDRLIDDTEDTEEGTERPPVVVVMGHVDHGKTSLLDYIRKANVTDTEAGGITQHIGAYTVECNGKSITFLDTPGHAAFTSMRARGASITDIAILVVAADDGIMPQTIEAINHAKAANVPIIVAINKMDKDAANPDNIKQQLTEHGLVIEEWGGDVICVPVSAKTGLGIEELLEQILVIAEVAELKANPNRLAKGAVVEARLDKGRGPIATLLIQNGTLRTGNVLIAGTAVGRVRVMTNDKGEIVTEAGPSTPVEITGLAEVPAAGDIFNAVEDERLARELVEERKHKQKQEQFSQYQKVTLDNLFNQIEQGSMKELAIIVKADVQGSVEAVRQSLEKLSNGEIRVRVIHGAVGAVSESDVMLADASNAIIVGFNVRPDPIAAENASRDGVDIRLYRVIYDAIEEIQTAMKGMLAPKFREIAFGRIEVRQVYKITGVGTVAGCYVLSGKVARSNQIRIVRDGIVIQEDKMSSLKRFKDDVKEVAEGYECGITLDKFTDMKQGDIFESFVIEEYRE
jgi:translation initiation factor IF-2